MEKGRCAVKRKKVTGQRTRDRRGGTTTRRGGGGGKQGGPPRAGAAGQQKKNCDEKRSFPKKETH